LVNNNSSCSHSFLIYRSKKKVGNNQIIEKQTTDEEIKRQDGIEEVEEVKDVVGKQDSVEDIEKNVRFRKEKMIFSLAHFDSPHFIDVQDAFDAMEINYLRLKQRFVHTSKKVLEIAKDWYQRGKNTDLQKVIENTTLKLFD